MLERVEIHHDKIDRADAVGLGLSHVLGQITPEEQTAVDQRMQGFHATVEHLGKTGVLGNIFHGEPRLTQCGGSPAGGEQFDPVRGQTAGQLDKACLVRNGEQRAPDFHAVTASAISGAWWNCIS